MSKKVWGVPSWWVQLDSPGTALTVGGWFRPGEGGGGGENYWGREGAILTQPLQ